MHKMTKPELVRLLVEIRLEFGEDPEAAHGRADDALLEYIDDVKVNKAFTAIPKWYA